MSGVAWDGGEWEWWEHSSVGDGIRPYLSNLRYCISLHSCYISVPVLDLKSDQDEAEDYNFQWELKYKIDQDVS